MKIFKGLLIFIFVFIVIFLVVTVFLPSHFKVERSIEIKSSPTLIYYLINDLHNWKHWDPWWKLDTTQVRIYNGSLFGKNASFRWTSKNQNIGNSEVKIVDDKPFEHLKMNFLFGQEMISTSEFRLFNFGEKVNVVWSLEGDLKFLAKWFRFFMDEAVGKDFSEGLSNLKKLAEKISFEKCMFFADSFPKVDIIFISDSSSRDRKEFLQKVNKNYTELFEFSKSSNLKFVGNPISVYKNISKYGISFDLCIPVIISDTTEFSGKIQKGVLPNLNVIRCISFGQEDFNGIQNLINEYLTKKGYNQKWKMFEMFYTDPLKTNTNDNISIFYCPI